MIALFCDVMYVFSRVFAVVFWSSYVLHVGYRLCDMLRLIVLMLCDFCSLLVVLLILVSWFSFCVYILAVMI